MGFDKAKAIRAAEKSLASGKIPSAIQEYARIVEHDPEDFNALNTLGDLYSRVEKKQEAAACFRRVAEHYREQGFTLKAVAMYKKLSRFAGEDHSTALSLAALYEQQGLLVEARQQYLLAADAYARAGSARESLDVLRRIADLDPADTKVRLRLAESYATEHLPDLAAEAYTEAGERLAARNDFEAALEAFNRALALRPALHAALHGMMAAHAALGTADDAAEVLEQAVKDRPGDLEVRAMLARAYVDAEDAARAEKATNELVTRDPSSFMLLYDVARLYLLQGGTEEATRLLARVAEPSLASREETPLAEMLQEVLARDPEQLEAHRLLVRAYTVARDEAKLRASLERLADAAEATGDTDEERRALTRLLRLAPENEQVLTRLESIGGPLFDDEGGTADDAPTFETFMLEAEAAKASPEKADAPRAEAPPVDAPPASEFEWNSVAEPQTHAPASDASASFADLNDLTDGGAFESNAAPEPPAQTDFQEFDFTQVASDSRAPSQGASVERMLKQELESVTFYIEQGYADIARDTLDMLERQYGTHPEIDALREHLGAAGPAEAAPPAYGDAPATFDAPPVYEPEEHAAFDASSAFEPTAFEPTTFEAATFETPMLEAETFEPVTTFEPMTFESAAAEVNTPAAPPPQKPAAGEPHAGANNSAGANNNSRPSSNGAQPAGIDPGLAAVFDEFREAVEDDGEEESGGDFDTHYQMGLAYREMGLLDQAVEEFQTAVAQAAPGDGTPRFLQCCNMLGHCFMEKGLPRPAALWFKKGLDAPGHSEDEYQAMRYDLGTAYERMGDNGRAIEVLSEVYAIDVSYRGVAERLRELQQKEVRG
ncbi:MAG TPA: tetratricopeptide repeat protein [Pyrinomonadaceae bacterium]|nr:tetratricopeptide repeat protein [Pyrinomonadaceae bacterium]